MSAKIDILVKKLAQTETESVLFNPYNELTKPTDDRTAPGVRQQNLRIFLNSLEKQKPKVMCFYYAPSYDESKRSGVPLTNVSIFKQVAEILDVERPFEKATKSRGKPELSSMASIIWDTIEKVEKPIAVWPIIPFYPHKKSGLKTERNFSNKELLKYRPLLSDIVEIFEPKVVLSIGKDSHEALKYLKVKHYTLPHPRRSIKKFEAALKRNLRKLK
jgi:hypothetical protein